MGVLTDLAGDWARLFGATGVMDTRQVERMLSRSRRVAWGITALSLVVLGMAIALTTLQVRDRIQDQITGRDAAVLHAVLLTQLEENGDPGYSLDPGDPMRQMTAVLVTSRLMGVLGARLFDAEGGFFESFPPIVRELDLSAEELANAKRLQPEARLLRGMELGELFYPLDDSEGTLSVRAPVLVVNVPLHTAGDRGLLGVAQFLIEGHTLAAELEQLDRHLLYQAGTAFVLAGAILVGALGWAFGRLRKAQVSISQRTAELQRANEELARAARTAAVGAITAHLIHGLNSPLAGLQSFVSTLGRREEESNPAEWETALLTTRRMQSMISQVMKVLREEESGARYELTLAELAETVVRRVEGLAGERGVGVSFAVRCEGVLSNNVSNLVMLIVFNLLENGVHAAPSGGAVRLQVSQGEAGVEFEVVDDGSGVPEAVRRDVFAPRRSTREGGSGLGLAISKQLANYLEATLELRRSSTDGSVFALVLPSTAVRTLSESAAGGEMR
jgi:signal transduction histidine kinase